MAREDIPISTGVDGLVKLVRERGRIGLREAAVELGISQGVIEEWAKVLEREGVMRIEYLFTKVYLTTPMAEKTEAQKKAKDIADMQVALTREVESDTKRLERVGRELDDMKNEFIGVSKVFEDKMASVRQRVRELDNLEKQYEELCFRCRCANEKFLSDSERLKGLVDESEGKLERIRKAREELEKEIKKVCPESPKSEKK
jgi:DNA repair exonuclease SbcCD ATPase subunit